MNVDLELARRSSRQTGVPGSQDGEDPGDGQGDSMSKTLYMVIENFRNGDAVPVYRRFRDRGRLAPTGLSYVSSWVSDNLDRCYQLMETEDRALLDQWIENWTDIVDFEVHAVISSTEAAEKIAPRL